MRADVTLSLLCLSTSASLLASLGTVLSLQPEDRISVWRGATLTALGFVFFLSLFELFNHLALRTDLGRRMRRARNLTCGDVLDINNKAVSAVQAWFCCATGAVVCSWSCTRDLLRSSHFMSEAYAWFGAAYFFYDIWSMYKVHVYRSADRKKHDKEGGGKGGLLRSTGDAAPVPSDAAAPRAPPDAGTFLHYCRNEPVILFHHLFIGGFGFLVIVYLRGGLGDCVFGFVYLMELSTPFVSARGILSRLRMKEGRLYVVNGIAMLVSFFFCRILSLPYVMLMYSRVVGLSYLQAIQSLPTGCQISILILLLPQVYWFYLMSAGAVKVFFPPAAAAVPAAGGASDNNNKRRDS